MILSQAKRYNLIRTNGLWKIVFLLLPFVTNAQVTDTLNNPSSCGLNISLSDYSCPENSLFYNPDRFKINVLNAPGTVLGHDVYLSEVRILLEHEWLSDMHIVLMSPGGQTAKLVGNIGGNGDHFGDTSMVSCTGAMRLQFASCTPLSAGQAPFADTAYRAQEDFYVFNDGITNPNQMWELQICDDLEDDIGILQFVELVFLPMECLPVQALTIDDQDTTSVTFSYTPNDGNTTAIVEIGPPGFTPGTDENPGQGTIFNVNTNPFTLSGLAEDTEFDIYIRKSCGDTLGVSINSCGNNFKTGCDPNPITSLETFDSEAICTPNCTQKCTLTGDWRNVDGDDFDWIAFAASSPSSNTGPDDDVTTGGQYLYIETNGSQCAEGAEAYLQSACFILDKQDSDTCNLSFSYHAKGLNIGTLRVEASEDGGISWTTIWAISGHQGSEWNKAYIGLGQYADGTMMQLRIVASKGNGVFGDIAVDHIALRGSVFSDFPTNMLYVDADDDGYGADMQGILTCLTTAPAGYVFNKLDCDDDNPLINPDAEESPCNGIDENCNGGTLDDDVILPIPVTTNDTICSGETPTITVEGAMDGFFVLWYDNPDAAGDFVGLNTPFSPSVPVNDSPLPVLHTFYVQVTDFVCENPELGVATVLVLPNPKGLIVGEEPAICPGESVNLASVDIQDVHFTGANLSYHNAWPTGAVNELPTSTVEPLGTTDYFYRLTNGDNCFYEDTLTVFRKDGPGLSFTPMDSFSLCRAFKDTIRATATGGVAPYDYFWSTGHSTQSIAVEGNFAANTIDVYGITVTDAEACFTIDSVIVNTTNSIDSLRVFSTDVTTCEGSDGTITVVPLNGQQPFAYIWQDAAGNTASSNGFQDTIRIANLSQNAYRLTITDSSPEGCEVYLRNIRVQGPGFEIADPEIDNPSCAGFSDGKICLDVTGSGAITYLWSTGDTISCADNLVAGSYSVTVSNGDCTTIEAFLLEEPDDLRLVARMQSPSCAETTDGSIQIMSFGGTPFYTYEWGTGQSIASLSSIGAGTYAFSLTDFNDCLLDTQIVLNAPQPLELLIDTLIDVSCYGFSDGLVRLEGNGGTSPYSYVWEDGFNASQRIALDTGSYTLSVTDFNQCTSQRTVTISEPDSLVLNLFSTTQPICKGDATGRIIVMPQGGTSTYEFHWNDGFITNNTARTGLEVGEYWIVLQDIHECTSDTLFVNLEPASSLSISATLTEAECVGLENGSISLAVGGVEPLSYAWSNGATTQNLAAIGVGEYCITVTDARGCIQDSCFFLDGPQLFSVDTRLVQPSCFGDNDGIIDQTLIEQGQPPFQFFWNDGSQHVDRLFLEPGMYDFTITDDNDCQFYSDTFTIVYPEPLSLEITDVGGIACLGDASAYFETTGVGGTPPYSYNWVGTGQETSNIYNLEAGEHELILSDARNCEIDSFLNLPAPQALDVDVDFIVGNVCEPDNFDELISTVSGGNSPYSYQWTTGETSPNLINPTPGDYFLTVTDANDCAAVFGTTKVKDRIPALLLDSFVVEQVSCFDGDDATMTAFVSGGSDLLSYHFSPTFITTTSADSVRVSGLSFDQNYSVTITDVKSSCVVESAIISGVQPDPIAIERDSFSVVNCFGGIDGAIFVTVTGGTLPYAYSWTNDSGHEISQNEDLPLVPAGIFHLEVTDSHLCTMMYSDSNVVTVSTMLEITDTLLTSVSCRGGNDGAIALEFSGATPPYFYNWSNGSSTEDIMNLTTGFYTVTVTDSDTCRTIFPSFFIPQPSSNINISATIDTIACFGDETGQIEATVSGGGGPPYAYRWRRNNIILPTITGALAENLESGLYQLSVIDTNNCEKNIQFTLDDPQELIANIINEPLGSDSLEVVISGGHAPYQPLWSNGIEDFIIRMLTSGNYEVLITDESGCQTTVSYLLTAINEFNPQHEKLLVYPNPSQGVFYIQADNNQLQQGTIIRLIDPLGRKIWSKIVELSTDRIFVDVDADAGIYQLIVQTKEGLVWKGKIALMK